MGQGQGLGHQGPYGSDCHLRAGCRRRLSDRDRRRRSDYSGRSIYVYRIEFQPLRDHAFIYFPTDYREAPKRDRLVVPRGNTIEHTLAIVQATGSRYRGGMLVEAAGLPDGVTFSRPPLKPGQTLTQATLTSSPDTKPWTGLIDLMEANRSGSTVLGQLRPQHSVYTAAAAETMWSSIASGDIARGRQRSTASSASETAANWSRPERDD